MATEHWTKDDDAVMARLLAPVLGEGAVYTRVWVCINGHEENGYRWSPAVGEHVKMCKSEENYPRQCHAEAEVELRAKDFADPAVGWGLFERWHALPENVGCEVLIARNLRDPFLIQMQFSERDGRTERFGFAERILEALLVAWRGALDAEGDHA